MAINPIVDSRDVRFILFEMLEIEKLSKHEKFSEFDKDTYEDVLNLAENIAVQKVYPINSIADKKGTSYDPATKTVTIPDEYKAGLDAYYEAGFMSMPIEQENGGMGMPEVIYSATTDFFSCASVAFTMYPMLSVGALNMITHFLPESPEKKIIVEKIVSGEWGASMCLTEPDAGSDVGALKTKAVKNADGTYSIKGNKIFISSGDNDYFKNMIHPVLARIEGDPAGTKGISIFAVPKINFDKTGKLTNTNDVVCSGIEHKMGIKASATCSLSFGDDGKCAGTLMGEERKGMKIMFQMMNEARLYVGSQGMSVSSAAYMHALNYAKDRLQGVHATQMMNPEAKSVAIIEHPDIKRLLLSMKSKVEAMRTLTYYCGHLTDLITIESGDVKKEAQALLDFLIPIAKAGNTDTSWDVTGDAIQVYGGYGYIADYPVEQYARDSKILSLYEGTNGIQSLDLAMRKLLMNPEQYNYSVYVKKIRETIGNAKGKVDDKYIASMEKALLKIDETVKYLKDQMAAMKFLAIFATATPLQKAFTTLTYAWMHLIGMSIAQPKMKQLVGDKKGEEREKFLSDNSDAAFYSGRVISGQHYIGSEFHIFNSFCDQILNGEGAVTKASKSIFSGMSKD
jgi:hypothetical protein